jgi:ribosomal 50S subunit-associated protein YjgA (DUF615 family)
MRYIDPEVLKLRLEIEALQNAKARLVGLHEDLKRYIELQRRRARAKQRRRELCDRVNEAT